jgi:hypothetical protein
MRHRSVYLYMVLGRFVSCRADEGSDPEHYPYAGDYAGSESNRVVQREAHERDECPYDRARQRPCRHAEHRIAGPQGCGGSLAGVGRASLV